MDIKTAFNTPALVKKILSSNTFSSLENGSINTQTFSIDTDSSQYTDSSKITISDIKTCYSDLGLISPQSDTVSVDNSDILKVKKDISKELMPSLLDISIESKKLYDEIMNMLNYRGEDDNYVLKETHLLLSLKALIKLDKTFIIFFSSSYSTKQHVCNTELNNIINTIWNILLSVCNSIKSLYTFISENSINYKYALKISTEMQQSLDSFNNLLDNLNYATFTIAENVQAIHSIKTSLESCIKNIIVTESSIPLLLHFTNVYSIIINSILSTIKLIPASAVNKSYSRCIDPISMIKTAAKLINHTIYAVNMTNSDIYSNYSLIITEIKSALSLSASINIAFDKIELHKSSITNVNLKNSYSKIFSADNHDKDIIKNKNMIKESTTKSISKTVQLDLSFYVCDLKIEVSGTIGSINFEGYIYYPHIYDLSFFGINDIIINTDIEINEHTSHFNINQCLDAELTAVSVIPSSVYSTSSPDSFAADISLELTINGELIITTVFPLLFTN